MGQIHVRAGEWDTQTQMEEYPYQERKVSKIIIHPHFEIVHNNVALLVVEDHFDFAPNVQPACLPPQDYVSHARHCYTMGWGKTEFGKLQFNLFDS